MAKIVPELDGIRGLAILGVIFHHVGSVERTPYERILSETIGLGWCGVDLFFVLSGFLITGILIDTKSTPGALRNFFARRVIRIVPLYYLSLLIFFHVLPAVGHLASKFSNFVPYEEAWYWLYLVNWSPTTGMAHAALSHLWSLSIEEQFYIIWPFVVFSQTRRSMLWICGGIIVASFCLRATLGQFLAPQVIYRNTLFRADALAFGALCALLVRNARHMDWIQKVKPIALASCLTGLVVSVAVARTTDAYAAPMNVFGFTCLGALFAYLVLWAAAESRETRFRSLIRSRVLRSIGKYSYAMYIFHVPITLLLHAGFRPWFDKVNSPTLVSSLVVVNFLVAVLLSFVAAVASWWLFENRFLQLKTRFEYSKAPAFEPTVAGIDLRGEG